MFCTNCGNKLTNKTNFCPSCGVENVSIRTAEIIVDPRPQTLDIIEEPAPQAASEGPVEIVTSEKAASNPPEPIQKKKPEIKAPLDIKPREQMGPSSATYSKMNAFGRIVLIWYCAISVVSVVSYVIAHIFMSQNTTLLDLLVGVILAALIVPAIVWLGTLPLFPWSRSFLLGRLNWKPFLYRILIYVLFVFGSLIFVFNTFTPRAGHRMDISDIAFILGFVILVGILVSCTAFFISRKSVKEITAKYGGGDHKEHNWGYLKPGLFLCLGLALPMISLLDIDKIGLRQSIITAAEDDRVKQYELADSFLTGDEAFRVNIFKYQFYLEMAASNGHGEAMYDIANNYESGRRGYDKDLSKYVKFMSQSAESDWEDAYHAQTVLGDGYYDGTDSFPQDKDRGIYWLNRAAENGGSDAKQRLRALSR